MIERLERSAALLRQQFVANAFEPMVGAVDSDAMTTGLLQRGALAYGLALLFVGFAYRRRADAPASSPMSYAELISTIPFGVACWTADGLLLACNEQYRARLNAQPSDIRVGASYAALVRRLVQGGSMQLVTEDDRSRLIELHREDGSCLMIDERPLANGGFVTLVTDVTESRRTDNLLHLDPRRNSACWPAATMRKSSRPRPPAAPRRRSSPISATISARRSTTSSALPN